MPTAYLEEVIHWEAQVARSDLATQGRSSTTAYTLREPAADHRAHPVRLDDGRLETFTDSG
jgi:hypothetical protein